MPGTQRSRDVCQSHGLMIIERGVAVETLASALRGIEGDLVYDALLAKDCQAAAVIGTEEKCQAARDELGIIVPEPKEAKEVPQLTVEPPTYDENFGFAFRCMHPHIQELGEIYITSFKNGGGVNFLAHEFTDPETRERYQMVIQKVSGETPIDQRDRYKARSEFLESVIAECLPWASTDEDCDANVFPNLSKYRSERREIL